MNKYNIRVIHNVRKLEFIPNEAEKYYFFYIKKEKYLFT